MSNQLEMEYQARMTAFVKKNHPCFSKCPDRCGTCKLTCEKLKEYEAKRSDFIHSEIVHKETQRSLNEIHELAKLKNTERS